MRYRTEEEVRLRAKRLEEDIAAEFASRSPADPLDVSIVPRETHEFVWGSHSYTGQYRDWKALELTVEGLIVGGKTRLRKRHFRTHLDRKDEFKLSEVCDHLARWVTTKTKWEAKEVEDRAKLEQSEKLLAEFRQQYPKACGKVQWSLSPQGVVVMECRFETASDLKAVLAVLEES